MTDQTNPVPAVYAAICAVQSELATTGIGKTRDNTAQNFKFRGVDEVYNSISRLLSTHKLAVLPRYTERTVEERKNSKGSVLIYSTVRGEFDFVSAVDGSTHTVSTFGEAMDSGDKSTNKAMAAAHKYALLQTFTVPTVGDNDPDATSHELGTGAPVRITTDEAEFIKGEIRDTGSDLSAFLNAFGIARVEDMPAAAYSKATRALDSKRRKNNEAAKATVDAAATRLLAAA